MKVSKNKLTSVKVSNSQKEQQTHEKSNRRLTRQVPATAGPWHVRRGTFSQFLTSIVTKHQKIEVEIFW